MIGVESFLARVTDEVLMGYGDFFGFIFVIEGVFVATIAPESSVPTVARTC